MSCRKENVKMIPSVIFIIPREALNKSDFVVILRYSQKISPYIS